MICKNGRYSRDLMGKLSIMMISVTRKGTYNFKIPVKGPIGFLKEFNKLTRGRKCPWIANLTLKRKNKGEGICCIRH